MADDSSKKEKSELDEFFQYWIVSPVKWMFETILKIFGTILAIVISTIIILYFLSAFIIRKTNIHNYQPSKHVYNPDLIDEEKCKWTENYYEFDSTKIQKFVDSLEWDNPEKSNFKSPLYHKFYKKPVKEQEEIRSKFIANVTDNPESYLMSKLGAIAFDYVFPPIKTKKHFFTDKDIKTLQDLFEQRAEYCEGKMIPDHMGLEIKFFKDNIYFFGIDGEHSLKAKLNLEKELNEELMYQFNMLKINDHDITEFVGSLKPFDKEDFISKFGTVFFDAYIIPYESIIQEYIMSNIETVKVHDGTIEISMSRRSVDQRVDYMVATRSKLKIYPTPEIDESSYFETDKNELFYCIEEYDDDWIYVYNEEGVEGWSMKKCFVKYE